MNFLIASDSFKGSLTSVQICEIAEKALLKAIPGSTVTSIPLADGGEGTVESLVINTGGTYQKCDVTNPFNEKVEATYGILGDSKTAIIEMSSASGIGLAKDNQLNPLVATSYGTGELILDAINKNCTKIVMGIGGSATNDGGLGMLQALGFLFLDEAGNSVGYGGKELGKIRSISTEKVSPEILAVEILVACDVNNPLLGENGATMIYGPQKGATQEMIRELEKGLENFGTLIENKFSVEVINHPGSGAAGGMGAGLLGCLNAVLKSGFDIISEVIELETTLQRTDYDYIFTGEGQLNHQTLNGKLPFGICKFGKKFNIPVIAVAGSIEKGFEDMYDNGLTSAFSITNGPMPLDYAMKNAEELLYQTYFNIAKLIKN